MNNKEFGAGKGFRAMNVVDRKTGETFEIVAPSNGDFIGVGHAGAMRYYRVVINRKWAIKLNKSSVSSISAADAQDTLVNFFGVRGVRKVLDEVKPMRVNPFPARVVRDYPELAEAAA